MICAFYVSASVPLFLVTHCTSCSRALHCTMERLLLVYALFCLRRVLERRASGLSTSECDGLAGIIRSWFLVCFVP